MQINVQLRLLFINSPDVLLMLPYVVLTGRLIDLSFPTGVTGGVKLIRLVTMPRPSNGVNLSLNQLERMLNQRRRELSRLTRKRATAQRKLDDIDEKLRRLGGNGSLRGGGRRARND